MAPRVAQAKTLILGGAPFGFWFIKGCGFRVNFKHSIPSIATYTYNAENQLTSTAGVTYTYDGDGKRVMKSSGTLYWYGLNSGPLMETTLTGGGTYVYYFFNGQIINRREFQHGGNVVDSYILDHLGNTNIVSGYSGNWDQSDFYPFGGERVYKSAAGNHYKFTGQERDPESGNDNFGARFYASPMGRFMSPDPGNAGASPHTPQSWNAYAYVLNNPLNATDPTGLNCVWSDGSYDADDDPVTGWSERNGSKGCTDLGGVWMSDVTGDWNPNGNTDLANQYAVADEAINNPNTPKIKATAWGGDPFTIAVITDLSARAKPLNKLSDCAGKATLNEIPFAAGSWLLKTPEANDDGVSNYLKNTDQALTVLEKLSENKTPARAVWAINKAGLPAASEGAENVLTKVVPKFSPYAKTLKAGGSLLTVASITYNTTACYNKPGD